MDVSTIAKDYTRLQKQFLNNLFDTMTLFQDHAEKTSKYWAYQMGMNSDAQTVADQYRTVLKQGRDNARRLINKGLANVEIYYAGMESKPVE